MARHGSLQRERIRYEPFAPSWFSKLLHKTNADREANMATYNLHEAKAKLSQLVQRAAAGEEITIARAGQPLVRLVPLRKPRPLGMFKGDMILREEFDAPLPDVLAAAFSGEAP